MLKAKKEGNTFVRNVKNGKLLILTYEYVGPHLHFSTHTWIFVFCCRLLWISFLLLCTNKQTATKHVQYIQLTRSHLQ